MRARFVTARTHGLFTYRTASRSTKDFGHWAGNGYDLSAYESVARAIAKHAKSSTIVVEKSTGEDSH